MLSSKVGLRHGLLWSTVPSSSESIVSNEHDIIIASIREYETSRGVGFECTTNKGSIWNDGNGGGTYFEANAPEHRHLERLSEQVFDDIISAYDLEQMCTESEEIQRYRAQRRAAGEDDALIFDRVMAALATTPQEKDLFERSIELRLSSGN